MDEIMILLVIVQMIATTVGAFFIAREAERIERAVAKVSAISFILPLVLYLIPYSLNPTLEKLTFFLQWMFISFIANEVVAIPTTIITQFIRQS